MSDRLKAIWKAAPRCALPARQPSALSTAFACRIVRRPAFMNSMLCVRDCNRCRHGGLPGERQAHVRWRRLKSLQIVLRLRELFRASQEETMPIDRSRIRKGMFLVSDQPLPGYTPKREPLPAEFEHFEQAAEAADRLQAIDHNHRTAISELTRRLEAVRQQLDGFK